MKKRIRTAWCCHLRAPLESVVNFRQSGLYLVISWLLTEKVVALDFFVDVSKIQLRIFIGKTENDWFDICVFSRWQICLKANRCRSSPPHKRTVIPVCESRFSATCWRNACLSPRECCRHRSAREAGPTSEAPHFSRGEAERSPGHWHRLSPKMWRAAPRPPHFPAPEETFLNFYFIF